MKKITLILFLWLGCVSANAQTFPSTDSLNRFIDKYIRNSAINAFTNLRLNTALKGIINLPGGTTVDTIALKERIDSLVEVVSDHVTNTSNPHNVTLGQVGYDSAVDHEQQNTAILNRALLNHTHAFTDLTGAGNVAVKNADNSFLVAQVISSDNGNIITANATDQIAGFQWKSSRPAARNWAVYTNYTTWGDWLLRKGNDADIDPYSSNPVAASTVFGFISNGRPLFPLLAGLTEYSDNTAAKSAGLIDGDIYRTGDVLKIVHQ